MSATLIWDDCGRLRPLKELAAKEKPVYDVCAIIVNRDRPDLTDSLVAQVKGMGKESGLSVDVVVVEMGSRKKSQHQTVFYEDEQFRGKCYGHNVGLRYAWQRGYHKYFWFLMNDLVFGDPRSLATLVRVYEENQKIAVLSPAELDSAYPGSKPRGYGDFRVVSTTDYLALLMSRESIERVGFLNPDFRYCWGAIHELAHFCNLSDRWVAYCDKVVMRHLGGTTYGKVSSAESRAAYQKNAKAFAAEYFREKYGKDWDRVFSASLPPEAENNNFVSHRIFWEGA
jgi:hypothetical protein